MQFGNPNDNPTDNPTNEPPEQTEPIEGDDPEPSTSEEISDIILSEDGTTVTGLKDESITQLTISPSYNGITVTRIGDDAFSSHSSLTSVTLPDTITEIYAPTHSRTALR